MSLLNWTLSFINISVAVGGFSSNRINYFTNQTFQTGICRCSRSSSVHRSRNGRCASSSSAATAPNSLHGNRAKAQNIPERTAAAVQTRLSCRRRLCSSEGKLSVLPLSSHFQYWSQWKQDEDKVSAACKVTESVRKSFGPNETVNPCWESAELRREEPEGGDASLLRPLDLFVQGFNV